MSSLHLRNEEVMGRFHGNATLLRRAQGPRAIPQLLLLPPSHLNPRVFRKPPQTGAVHVPLPFQLRIFINKALCHGIIVCLLAAISSGQNYANRFGGWERIVRSLFVSHGMLLLLGACPDAITD